MQLDGWVCHDPSGNGGIAKSNSELGGLAQLRQKQVRIFGLVFSCAKRKKKLSRKFEVT